MALLRSETRIYGNATVDTFLKIDGTNTDFPATSNSTGALRVAGGIGVKGNVFSSGNIISLNANLGNLVTANYFSGTITTANQYNITNVGTLTNLTVSGNTTLTGNLIVTGTTVTVNSNNVSYEDSLIELHTTADLLPLSGDDGKDIGIHVHYYKTIDKHAFFGFSNDTQAFEYYVDGTETNGVFSGVYGNIKGQTFISNTATGIAPLVVASTTKVTNLNADLLDGYDTSTSNTASTVVVRDAGGNISANYIAGTLTTANQYNITNLGIMTGITLIGPAILGNVANVTIYGGTDGDYLKTDGQGKVVWASVTSGTGNANISGSDTQIFFNNSGSNTLGSSANLTFNKTTKTLTVTNVIGELTGNVTGNLTGNVTGNLIGNTYGNVYGNLIGNSYGNLTGNVTGNVYGNLIGNSYGNLTGNVTGNVYGNLIGNSYGNLTGNVTGNVYGNLIGNSYGNLTGDVIGNVYGNLIGNISGNIAVTGGIGEVEFIGSAGNLISSPNLTFIASTNTLTANYFSGNGSLLTSLTGSNVSGNVAWAVTSNWANTANAVAWSAISGTPTSLSGYGITDSFYSNTNAGAYLTTYSGNLTASNVSFTGSNVSLGSNSNVKINGGTTGTILSTDGTGNLSWITPATVVSSGASSVVGNAITLGTSTDTDLVTPGAITTWTTATKVTDAIDDLNETLENIRNSTYVKSVTFTASPTAGGAGTSVTLTITSVGTPNRYDITWGDGTQTLASSSATPSHTYSTNTNSPFTVTVRAYNNGGSGTGSEASLTRTGYITIYTANPVVSFGLYRASTGGLALTGITLYASEGETIYLDNTTTNTTGATVTYSINWGDSSTPDTISSDSVAGGVGGGRISHSYASGQNSSTGTKTITVTITSHSTATPSYIATSPNSTAAIKVYNPGIAAPNGLSAKTITFQTSVGTSPYLAANYANNAGAAVTITAGSSISRVTSGTPVETVVMPTYASNADSGYLRAVVNNTEDGNISLTTGSQAGTNLSLVLLAESDYNLLDATGTTTTFGLSIYSPSLYKGFTAKVSKTNSALTAGLNTFKLSHSSTGNTNIVEFVKDDVTSVPTVDVSTATLSSATNGTYRYISGVPYYNTGSPTITLAGAKVYNWIGQTYQNTTTPFQIEAGTNDESTSGSVVASQTRTYTQIDGSTTFLSSGIPKANTGNTISYQYTLGSISANITTSSVASVQTVKFLVTNVNGSSAYAIHSKKVQVFTATPSGFVEDSITCTIAEGVTPNSTPAKRIVLAGTGPTRAYSSSTNYYSSGWSGAQTIAGTDSAVVRWNTLKWFNTDLSGYLPAGPDLSTGRSGTQYFFGAFTRLAKSSFSITISGKISGLRFAIPGVTDSYTGSLINPVINGWLDATVPYFGAGAAGANDSGCADGTAVPAGSTILGTTYKITFGTNSTSSSNNSSNQVLFSIALASGDSITSWSFS